MTREAVLGAVREALGRNPGDDVAALAPFQMPQAGTDDLVRTFRAALEEVDGEFLDARSRDIEDVLTPFRTRGAGIVHARWGIAETGTVVIERDGDQKPSLLPTTTVLLLAEDDLVAGLQDLPAPGASVRCRMLITGPSRTADIEKRLVLGAHGPKRVVVVLTRPSGATQTGL